MASRPGVRVLRRRGRRKGETDMAMLINDNCTACDACEPVCPNTAITAGNPVYVIDPAKCTECVGAEDEPQCVMVCPAEAIVNDPNLVESKEELLAKYQQLHAA
jgi:ferredoxin